MKTANKFDFMKNATVDFSAGTGAKERVWARVEAAMNDCYEINDNEIEMLAAAGQPFVPKERTDSE